MTGEAPAAIATWTAHRPTGPSEYRDAVPRAHAALLHRVVAGTHHVTREQCCVRGHAGGDATKGHVGVRNQRLLGLGSLERAEHRAVAEGARAIARVVGAAQAEEARPAGSVVATEDPVAHAHARDVRAGGDHGSDELVADREAGLHLDPAVVDVEVRAADAGRLDLDDRIVARVERRLGAILDSDDAGRLEGDRSHRPGMMSARCGPERPLPPAVAEEALARVLAEAA